MWLWYKFHFPDLWTPCCQTTHAFHRCPVILGWSCQIQPSSKCLESRVWRISILEIFSLYSLLTKGFFLTPCLATLHRLGITENQGRRPLLHYCGLWESLSAKHVWRFPGSWIEDHATVAPVCTCCKKVLWCCSCILEARTLQHLLQRLASSWNKGSPGE